MVLLNQIIQVLALPDANRFLAGFVCVERGQHCCVGATFIDSDHFRRTLMANPAARETQGCCGIPLSRQQKVDGMACCIGCPVQIFPLACDFTLVSSIRQRRPAVRLCRQKALSRSGTSE